MKDIQIIDLIIADINKFLLNNGINPVYVNLIQMNGVPFRCEGDITEEKLSKINDHLKKYKDPWEIRKLIIKYRYGSIKNMENKIGKKRLAKRYQNLIKNQNELYGYLEAESVLKLK